MPATLLMEARQSVMAQSRIALTASTLINESNALHTTWIAACQLPYFLPVDVSLICALHLLLHAATVHGRQCKMTINVSDAQGAAQSGLAGEARRRMRV